MTMKRKTRNLDNGSFYVSRKIFKGDMRGDPHLLLVWVTCLGWAYWRDGSDCHGGKQQIIKRGQFATSAYELGETLGISRNIVLRCLNRLSIDARIRLDKSPHGTLITVLNYDKYKASSEADQLGKQQASNQVSLQQHDSSMTAAQQHQPHNNKSNKVTKLKREKTGIGSEGASRPSRPKNKKPSDGSLVWDVYSKAYLARYGQEPIRNARVNAQCSQLVGRLGLEAAKKVVVFFLTHNNSFYIRQCHAIGLALKDAEALHTQMLADYRLTSTEANRYDKRQSTMNALQQVAAEHGINLDEG